MSIFEDIAELFAEGAESLRERRDGHLAQIGHIIDNDEPYRAQYHSMLADIQSENSERLDRYRQRLIEQQQQTIGEIESRVHQVEQAIGSYMADVMADVMGHEREIEEMMAEHQREFGVYSVPTERHLEPVNWKKEGF